MADIDLSDIAAGTGGFVINGQCADDYSGESVVSAGDVNGDGLADLIVGVRNSDPAAGSKAGRNYVVFGKSTGTAVDLSAVAAGAQTTGIDGSTTFTGITEASLALAAERAVPDAESSLTEQAVNLQDAIAILKLIVGLEVNGAGNALSPYQALAADYDGNGQVQLTDAIGVLKHVVGLEAPAPAWHFASETDTAIPQLAPLSPGAPPAISVDLSVAASPAHVGLVAYLSGDVDSSYAGASGGQNLDDAQPDYFATLAKDYGLDPAQFGIYA